eukprot:1160112-Pelagomonas_calceolata.AAC.3
MHRMRDLEERGAAFAATQLKDLKHLGETTLLSKGSGLVGHDWCGQPVILPDDLSGSMTMGKSR